MSEEIKDIILDVKDSLNETPKNMYKYNKITLNLNEFEEILNYIEQLENIRKEAIRYIQNNQLYNFDYDKEELFEIVSDKVAKEYLLNILNKGDNNGK